MNVLKTAANLTNKEKFQLCHSSNTKKMKELVGKEFPLGAWAMYTDADAKDPAKINTVLAIIVEGEVYATISATFIEDFTSMIEFFESVGEPVEAIKVSSGMSKSGREFLNCSVA